MSRDNPLRAQSARPVSAQGQALACCSLQVQKKSINKLAYHKRARGSPNKQVVRIQIESKRESKQMHGSGPNRAPSRPELPVANKPGPKQTGSQILRSSICFSQWRERPGTITTSMPSQLVTRYPPKQKLRPSLLQPEHWSKDQRNGSSSVLHRTRIGF